MLVGFLHDSYLRCNDCLTGNEIFCEEREVYSQNNRDQAGFGSRAVWKAAFLFHAIPSVHAAPLMCAGTTVFNAMEMDGVRPTQRVGILGIDGPIDYLYVTTGTDQLGCLDGNSESDCVIKRISD
ncbi:hypothetical protein J3R82DRAFT_11507 [Butyriboletus roseoflavus]|nr:hypothetical protein J3R82DRAFT_11507 [Butyriboletus roseoflavus]